MSQPIDPPIHFEIDIKPLFRADDQDTMLFAFDLWNCQDVRKHAELILERLTDGSMPCDGEWPAERLELFRRWMRAGGPE